MSNKVYEIIEERVLDQLKNGIIPWKRCYNISAGDVCISHQTGKAYSLTNQFFLENPGEYWSFKNVQDAGYTLRKGCHASKVVFWKILTDDDDPKIAIPLLRYYNVFHESDVVGLPPKPIKGVDEETRRIRNEEKIKNADELVAKYLDQINKDLSIVEADCVPCFIQSRNTIKIPERARFDSINHYYSALFHEMVHSTKEALGRKSSRETSDRAKEELVAEIGAAYLCGHVGIRQEDIIDDVTTYCAGWLKPLSGNISNLLWASRRAEDAVNYILGIPKEVEQTKEGE